MTIDYKNNKAFRNAGDVAEIMRTILKKEHPVDQDKEHFWVIGRDNKNRIKYLELVSLGTLNSSLVHPREVFRYAIMQGIASLILCHNHPSGDPEPSKEDVTITDRLVEGGKILGIHVLDHVIIGSSGFLSMTEKGYIKQ